MFDAAPSPLRWIARGIGAIYPLILLVLDWDAIARA
jgi:hypothetical protein